MACSIEKQNQIIEAAKVEYKRLAALKEQGYEEDLENGILDIQEAMDNMRAIAYKKPQNIVVSEVQQVDEMFINELNNNNPKDGKVKIQILSGVKTAKGKLIYTVKYPNNNKEYKLPASRITADQVSASNTGRVYDMLVKEAGSEAALNGADVSKYSKLMKDVILKLVNPTLSNDPKLTVKAIQAIISNMAVTAGQYVPRNNTIKLLETNEVTGKIAETLFNSEYTKYADIKKELMDTNVYAKRVEFVEAELKKYTNDHTILHELVHTGSVEFMRNNPKHPATKRVQEIFELAKKEIDNTADINFGYWKTNEYEFLAEALSNPKMIRELMSIQPTKKYSKLSNLFESLVDTLLGMIGLDTAKKESAFEYLLDGYFAMVEKEFVRENPKNTQLAKEINTEADRLLKNSTPIVAGGTTYMSKEAYATDMKVAQTRQMAVKLEDERASKLNDKAAWKKYTDSVPKGVYGHDRYSGALGNVIEKLVGPKIVTDVAGLMLSKVHEDNIVVGDYNLDTHTLQIAKEPTKEEIANASETALVQLYINKNSNNVDMDKLVEFVGANKAKAIERILDTVEKVRGSHVLTHELIHAGSSRFMRQNPNHPAVKRVEELYNEAMLKKDDIQSLVNHGDIITTRWQANKDEFVAEALSNPGLMNALSQIETTNKDKLSNMLKDLIDSLLDMLGLSKKVKNNLLEFTMDGFAAIIEAQSDKNTLMTDKVRDLVKKYRETNKAIKGSDQNTGIGESVNDEFIGQEETDLGQVLADDFAAYYDADVQEGREIQTQEFADLQNTIVDIYQKTMQDLGTGNVKLRMFENLVEPTAGQIDLRTKEMQIRWNKMSRLSRVSEVFLHEVNHLMSSHVFKDNIKLRRLMEDLRNSALDSGVTYKLFLEGIQNPTKEEIEIAKMKFEYTFDKTANVEEFYAYATTNEQVYNAIKDVKITSKLVKELDLDPTKKEPFKKVMNRLIKIVNDIWKLLSGRGETGGKMIVDMIHTIARLDAEQTQKNWKDESGDIGLTDYAKNKISQLDEKLEPVVKKVEEWNEKLSAKQGASWLGEKIKQIPVLNDLLETGISQYLWRMVTQDTTANDVADMYMVFRHSKQVVEKHTADIRNGVKAVADELYKDLDKDTKNAITRIVLEADLAQFSATEIKAFIEDSEKLDSEIGKLMVALKPKSERMRQIEGLAEYLVSGKTILHNQQMNANNIVTGLYKEQKKYKKANREDVKLVDKLVSLIALKNSDRVQVELLRNVDNDVLDKTINMYRGYIDNMRANATLDAHDPIPKGYIRPEDGLIKYELIPEEEVKAQESVLMKLVDEKPYAVVDGRKYYLMTGRTKSVGFNEGAIGLISHTTEGIPVSSLIRKNNELSGKLELMDGELKRKTRNIILAISRKEPDVMKKFHLDSGQTLVPVYDHQNNLVDYRIQLTKLEKEMYLTDRKTELEDVLSHTFSRSIKTSLTATENKRVVDTIIEHSAAGVLERPQDYVLVEEYTEEDRLNGVKREKRHDRWEYLPDHTKDYIFQKTKNKGILIHKDFVELMTGEKDVTIGNFAKFGIDLKKYPVARARLMALESYLAEILGYVKNAMVVLNADVLLGNQTSNAIVAITHGINPIEYAKKFKTRWQQLNDYNEKSQQLAELEVKRMAGENVENRMKQLKRQLEGNIWDELVKDGQYTALVEDINIEGQGEGQLLTMAKNYLEKKNWLGAVNAVKNVLYINKTTNLYNSMLKTVHYGDAITRQIIKEELEKKAIKRDGKVTKEVEREILNYLDQLLVNYGYTMNRWFKYAERVGGLFFMKYYLSQAKALMSLTKRNPAKTMLMQGSQFATGIDVQDPFDTYLRSGIDGISYRWMLDDAPEQILQPNIFDLIPSLDSIVKIR